jgi:predicted lipid-binding transport protein (Tim44 family)
MSFEMVYQKEQGGKSETDHSVRFGFLSLLGGILTAVAITQNWFAELAAYQQVLLWMAGGITFGFGLTRMFPRFFTGLFQGVGYVAGFCAVMLLILFAFEKELPSLKGSLNTDKISQHMSETADDLELAADTSKEVMAEAVAGVQEAIYSGADEL